MDEGDRAKVLRDAGFDLSSSSMSSLVSVSRVQPIASGDYLFHKGDPCTALHVILSGTLQSVSTSYEGQDLVFGEFGPGGVIGELTVLDASPRSSSIRATRASELLTLDRDPFLELAYADAAVAISLAQICANRAKRLSTWAEGASFADTVGRLASRLIELSSTHDVAEGSPVKLKLTQQSLADQLGITRESINKALRSLEEEGLVALGRGSVTLLDVSELEWKVQS